ncbi:transglycosylase domain-containing protein [Streptomyces sp. NPDC001667]
MGRAKEKRARGRAMRRDRRRERKKGIRRFFTWKTVIGTVFGLCLLATGAFYAVYVMVPIPEANAMAQRQNNVYKYSDGTVLARTGQINRDIVALEQVPKQVQDVFVAAENMTFYQDNGVDLMGTVRGLWNTVSGKGKQGGSTITQQYVKNFYLNQDQTPTRKLKELVISLKVDQRHDKSEILAGYLNTNYFGRGAYGIQAAAKAYYGVDCSKLTVEQGAYLAALLQAPSQYDWTAASDIGKKLVTERWNYVLDNAVKMKAVDAGRRAAMKFPTPAGPKPAPGTEGRTGYLVQAANTEMRKQGISEQELHQGSWTITLNIDRKKQKLLEDAVKAELTSKLDPRKTADQDVQVGAVSVDPKNGSVLALYGGQDHAKHQLSNATATTYQPGSTFKPVVLASALDNGATTQDGKPIKAETIYNGDSEVAVKGSGGDGYAPPNLDDISHGPVTVQEAMNKSVNTAFAQMGVDVGLDQVQRDAFELGMADIKQQKPLPSMSLGSYGASPLQMAGVYATLNNHGKKVIPTVIQKADHPTRSYDSQQGTGTQVISRAAADAVTSVLTGVVDDGSARKSVAEARNRDGRQVAGKTGTSDDNKSAWFVGYTANLVTSIGLWGEAAQPRQVKADGREVTVPKGGQVSIAGAAENPGRIAGGGTPARIWSAYTFDAVKGDHTQFDLQTEQKPTNTDPTPSAPPATPLSPTSPVHTPFDLPMPTPPRHTPSSRATVPTDPPSTMPTFRPTPTPTPPMSSPTADPSPNALANSR